MTRSTAKFLGRTLPVAAALLVAASTMPGAAQAAVTRPGAHTQTMGGYVYSWFEWAIAYPKSLLLGVDADVAAARAALISDIGRLKAMVGRTGFSLETVSVEMGLIPTVSLSLDYDRAISEQERAALNADLRSGKFGILERALLDALLEASSATVGTEADGLVLTGVDVDVDVIPQVTLNFEEPAPTGAKE